MRLELGKIHIKDIQFANESKIEANVLYVNKEELIKAVLRLLILKLLVREKVFVLHQ